MHWRASTRTRTSYTLVGRGAHTKSTSRLQGVAALRSILPLTGYLFGFVCYREVLMDINDRAGDAAIGVRTLPVRFGGMASLAVATGCFLSGVVGGLKGLCDAKAAAAIAGAVRAPAVSVQLALQALLLMGVWPALVDVWRMRQSGLDSAVVSAAVGNSFKPIAAGLLVLSLV